MTPHSSLPSTAPHPYPALAYCFSTVSVWMFLSISALVLDCCRTQFGPSWVQLVHSCSVQSSRVRSWLHLQKVSVFFSPLRCNSYAECAIVTVFCVYTHLPTRRYSQTRDTFVCMVWGWRFWGGERVCVGAGTSAARQRLSLVWPTESTVDWVVQGR